MEMQIVKFVILVLIKALRQEVLWHEIEDFVIRVFWCWFQLGFAKQIADYFQSGGAQSDEFAVGLHKEFQPLEGHDIGQFPGLESKEVANEAQAYQLTTWKHIKTKRLYGFGNCIGC